MLVLVLAFPVIPSLLVFFFQLPLPFAFHLPSSFLLEDVLLQPTHLFAFTIVPIQGVFPAVQFVFAHHHLYFSADQEHNDIHFRSENLPLKELEEKV